MNEYRRLEATWWVWIATAGLLVSFDFGELQANVVDCAIWLTSKFHKTARQTEKTIGLATSPACLRHFSRGPVVQFCYDVVMGKEVGKGARIH